MQQCNSCGVILATGEIPQLLVSKGRRNVTNDECSEGEYITRCPDCGAAESFDEVVSSE